MTCLFTGARLTKGLGAITRLFPPRGRGTKSSCASLKWRLSPVEYAYALWQPGLKQTNVLGFCDCFGIEILMIDFLLKLR